MLLGPIFHVEMVSVTRRRRYFVLRVVYAAILLFVLWSTYSSMRFLLAQGGQQSIQQSAALAASFFMSFSWLQMMAILVVGPSMAVGTIASERERRTIEYLFATDLSNAEIVVGKTIARLLLLGQFVLVGLPILFIFRLLGGIPSEALLATFLLAAGTAWMLTGLSIAVSVWSPKARDASVRIYLALIVLFSLPGILYAFQLSKMISDSWWRSFFGPVADGLLLINPISSLKGAMGNAAALGFGIDIQQVVISLGCQFLVGVASLLLAVFAVRRVHLSETTRSAVKRTKWQVPRFRQPLGDHAMRWKEMFSSTSTTSLGRIGWIAVAIILTTVFAAALWAFVQSFEANTQSQRDDYLQFLIPLTGFMGSGVLLLLAARAAGLISQEKEHDCWLSLISTSLTGREIINGKLWGNLYSSRWMGGVLLAVWLLGLLIDAGIVWPLLVTSGLFLLLAGYVTCLGLFFSLRSPTTLRAMGLTLATLVFTGGGYLFCCCTVGAFISGREWEVMLIFCVPFLLVFPGISYHEFVRNTFWTDGPIVFAFVFGLVFYTVVAVVLYAHMVAWFDRYAGRIVFPKDQARSG